MRRTTVIGERAPSPAELELRASFEIAVPPPFNFAGTVFKPSHFPCADMVFDGTRYWRTLRLGDRVLAYRLTASGSARRPTVKVDLYAARAVPVDLRAAVERELNFRFDLATDLEAFEGVCGKDRLLAPALERWRGMRPSAGLSLYEFLVVATVLQNTTVRRSRQMLAALFQRFGEQVRVDERTLAVFWEPRELADADEQELRSLKLGYRARTLKRPT
jgi:3-methyladenine DNA glycosylase/8-oxoguanine DNA glycosylase